jgi:Tfp pilus assembly protein PilN
MINLLPPEVKAQTNAARANRLLLRYNVLLLAAVGFLLVSIGIVYVYLGNAKAVAETTIANNTAKAGDYTAAKTEADEFRQNLANARQILDNDVTYTKVILEVAAVLPPGVVLDTLSLDSQTFGTPTTLSTNVTDYATVLRLKDSLQASTIFTNVSIQTISDSGSGSYPLTATFSVTIRKDAAR